MANLLYLSSSTSSLNGVIFFFKIHLSLFTFICLYNNTTIHGKYFEILVQKKIHSIVWQFYWNRKIIGDIKKQHIWTLECQKKNKTSYLSSKYEIFGLFLPQKFWIFIHLYKKKFTSVWNRYILRHG